MELVDANGEKGRTIGVAGLVKAALVVGTVMAVPHAAATS